MRALKYIFFSTALVLFLGYQLNPALLHSGENLFLLAMPRVMIYPPLIILLLNLMGYFVGLLLQQPKKNQPQEAAQKGRFT